MADEIVARYRLDTTQWVAGAERIDAGTKELVNDNKKLETSFAEVSKSTAKAFSADGAKQFNKEAGKALKDVKKETDNLTTATKNSGNAFTQLKKDLKSVQGDLATLSLRGREGSKLFKALSADAGQLKDQMADLGDAINQQGASPLENFTGSIGSAKSALLNLDIEGAARSFGIAGAQIGKISFKELSAGVAQVGQSFVKLAASILTSPLFLVAGAVTAIVYTIATWGDSLEDIRAKNDKLIAGIDKRLSVTTAGYDAEIILLEAAGAKTEEIEKKKLAAVIRATEQKVRLRQKELAFEEDAANKIAAIFGESKAKEVKEASEASKEITDLENELKILRAELKAVDIKSNKEAEDKKLVDTKKANDEYKKLLDQRLNEGIKKFNEAVDRERFNEQQKEKEEITEANKKIEEIITANYSKQIQKRKTLDDDLRDIRRKALETTLKDEKQGFDERQEALNEAYKNAIISDEEFTQKSFDLTMARIDAKRFEFEAAVQLGQDLISIGTSFAQIARDLGMENAEGEKALAVFGVAMNLAQSLGNIILGATQAAAATGALAPLTLAGFIASGTATVLAAFAQVTGILTQEPPSFAYGGWTGEGGKFQPAGIVHADEFVSTKENTNRYWDELNAMHDGTYEDLLWYKHIEPALANAITQSENNRQAGFAESIANSMLLNGFKDGNILNAFMKLNNSEGKRHNELIGTLKKVNSKSQYRKK